MKKTLQIGPADVLLVIDVQNGFCAGGSLEVPGGDEIVPLVNRIAKRFAHVVLTQDWHPAGHRSFASAHPGRKPFETIELTYGPQVLWPDHCVQGSPSAAFHPDLDIPHAALVLRKGLQPDINSYSAFFENDRTTATGLGGYLHERGLGRVFLVGLALDFCVRYSAEDAVRSGFAAVILEDACRAINMNGSLEAAQRSFAAAGIACVTSDAVEHPRKAAKKQRA